MGSEDLTVQVLNLSPRATLAELNTFFSYCGTVHQIKLLRDKDQLPYALVTFGQPYAFQTALLLDDAILGGQPIYILPANAVRIPIVSDEDIDQSQAKSTVGLIPKTVETTMWIKKASKGVEMLKKSKEELVENLKRSEKGRAMMEQTRSAIYPVEQAAGRMAWELPSSTITTFQLVLLGCLMYLTRPQSLPQSWEFGRETSNSK